jgi:error-prone DNA polymerase
MHPGVTSAVPTILADIKDSVSYAELQTTTNFTFLTGASHPEECVERAAALGHGAASIADINTLAGVVRAHVAAKQIGIPLAVGSRLHFVDTPVEVIVYPTDVASYARLSTLLTLGKRRAAKGECRLFLSDLLRSHKGLLAIAIPPRTLDGGCADTLQRLMQAFNDDRFSIGAALHCGPDDAHRFQQLQHLARDLNVSLAAVNDVHYHDASRRALQDVLTCIRHTCTLEEAGLRLLPNAERRLKSPREMRDLFSGCPEALRRTRDIAARATQFSLDQLRYEYPREVSPPGVTPMQHLIAMARRGADARYPEGVPGKVQRQLEHEFALIEELDYAKYFLTVYDIVVFARSRGILCQGRGAAANSAVCYCLGVTAVDPDTSDLLFERFVSRERNEPPDIDIDFEHERREEVIQHIYNKFGRDRAALTAEVISYRGASAIRDVGKALGLSLDALDCLSKNLNWWERGPLQMERLRELGFNDRDPTLRRFVALTGQILGFPRHLSQHVGGFVITEQPLSELVPIEHAAMEDRTVIEWDKDDIDAMGMLKIDVLGLGMLTAIRKAFDVLEERGELGNWGTGELGYRDSTKEVDHGEAAFISGSGCVALWNGADERDLQSHRRDAEGGAVWADKPDSSCGGVDTLKHRRGIRKAESPGLPEAPAHRARILGGTGNATRVNLHDEHAAVQPADPRPHRSGRTDPLRSDPQPRTNEHLSFTTDTSRPLANDARPSPSHPNSPIPQFPNSPPPPTSLASIPPGDPDVYDMICKADTIGVFQIESRAQMSMLPRLRPRTFYDLVIEVAIVRPGPIQGNMVHPYLRRRNGEEPIEYPTPEVKQVLEKTLGVPLFQEQAMSLAIVAAGFTPDEADQLRRAMAAWKRKGNAIDSFHERFVGGMLERGYQRDFAERCFEQLKGFSEYGFPESHAASFALLVYVSSWLKYHYPAIFAAAIINSQPMGFYAPAQIVEDAKRHGVEVRAVDVNYSGWECGIEKGTKGPRDRGIEGGKGTGELGKGGTGVGEGTKGPRDQGTEGGDGAEAGSLNVAIDCEPPIPQFHNSPVPPSSPALRLGFRLVSGLSEADGRAIEEARRRSGPFDSIAALWRAAGVRARALRTLAAADAFRSMGLDRRQALWEIRALRDEKLPIFEQAESGGEAAEEEAHLPEMSLPMHVMQDYRSVGLSLKAHPLTFIRDRLEERDVTRACDLRDEARWANGREVSVAGIVLVRQRPSTALGIIFMTLEDETGIANIVLRPQVYDRFRQAARNATVMLARGRIERQGDVCHVQVHAVEDLSEELRELVTKSRDFH